ncbi:hypothetical protein LXA43DRAFT_992303 [Ganoderma leucocontextum]|nr:hypothetical protein LXA43DRAFT_992303 [Ganoderma leucocontextum]
MPNDDRPLKRARLSEIDSTSHISEPASSTITFEPHDEFWLPDGNIILVARNTAFRVYRALIAAQSTVFEDMFTVSTSNSDELFEGCSVVHLSDSPEDLAHLFRILLPKSQRQYHSTERRTFNEVSAVIRLAHKYHIQDVQDQALASLQESTLSPHFSDWYKSATLTSFKGLNQVIGVVNLARLTDSPALLPGALYICSHLGGKLVDGWEREDGTIEMLSVDDLRRCLDGYCVLARETTLLPARVFATTRVEGCNTPARCQLSRQWELVNILSSKVTTLQRRALASWQKAIEAMAREEETSDTKICGACEKDLLKRDRRERWLLWKRLPDIFAITVEGWGVGTEDESEGEVNV